jgi:hypothetical protein
VHTEKENFICSSGEIVAMIIIFALSPSFSLVEGRREEKKKKLSASSYSIGACLK